MDKNNNILCFDLGTTTGFAYFEHTKVVDLGNIFFKGEIKQGKTIKKKCKEVLELFTQNIEKYNPDLIVFEEVQFVSNRYAFAMYNRLITLLELAANNLNIPMVGIGVATIKSNIKQEEIKASKETNLEIANSVQDKMILEKKQQDIADSICLGLCYLKLNGFIEVEFTKIF